MSQDVFEVVDLPNDRDVPFIKSRWVWKLKVNLDGTVTFKARLVARGDLQDEDTYDEKYLPTSRAVGWRTLCSIGCQEGHFFRQFDIQCAFVSADIDRELYMSLPQGLQLPPGKCVRLKKSLYGMS